MGVLSFLGNAARAGWHDNACLAEAVGKGEPAGLLVLGSSRMRSAIPVHSHGYGPGETGHMLMVARSNSRDMVEFEAIAKRVMATRTIGSLLVELNDYAPGTVEKNLSYSTTTYMEIVRQELAYPGQDPLWLLARIGRRVVQKFWLGVIDGGRTFIVTPQTGNCGTYLAASQGPTKPLPAHWDARLAEPAPRWDLRQHATATQADAAQRIATAASAKGIRVVFVFLPSRGQPQIDPESLRVLSGRVGAPILQPDPASLRLLAEEGYADPGHFNRRGRSILGPFFSQAMAAR